MDKKDFLIIALKVIIYACTSILAVLGVSAMSSCSASRFALLLAAVQLMSLVVTVMHVVTLAKCRGKTVCVLKSRNGIRMVV